MVHSEADDPHERAVALCKWAQSFEEAYGRPPTVWLEQLCADMSLSDLQLLAHLPVYQAKCHRLLILAGQNVPDSLYCALELYLWTAIGGRIEDVDVEVAASNAGACQLVVAAFDAFHVMHAGGASPAVAGRIEHAIALASVTYFNTKVRDFMPLVKLAGVRFAADGPDRQKPSEVEDKVEDEVEDVAHVLSMHSTRSNSSKNQLVGPCSSTLPAHGGMQ